MRFFDWHAQTVRIRGILVYASDRVDGVDGFVQPASQVHPLPLGAVNDKVVGANDTILDPPYTDVGISCVWVRMGQL